MKKMSLHATLQLSIAEYSETISSLVFEHYQRAVSEEELFRELNMKPEEEQKFPVEYSTILLVIAALAFKQKPKMTADKYREEIQNRAAESVYKKIFPDADKETIDGCMNYFTGKLAVFEQICTNIYKVDPASRQKDIIGFSRYLAAQLSESDEKSLTKALQSLGVLLSSATDTFTLLIANTVQDTMRLNRKPSFTVQK